MHVRKANRSSSINTEDIIKYYDEGHTIKECGLKFGLHPESIRVRFRKAGVKDCRHKLKPKLNNIKKIINFYNDDHSIEECSAEFNISVRRIRDELSSRGLIRNRDQVNDLIGKRSKELWKDDSFRDKCVSNNIWDKKRIEKASEKTREMWDDDFYRDEVISSMKNKWKDDDFKSRMLNKFRDDENRSLISSRCIDAMKDPGIRDKISRSMIKIWGGRDYQRKMAKVRASQRGVSSLQMILYSILDDLGVKYYREYEGQLNDPETTIGPYNFDCVIPVGNKKLLVECQGDYWHSLPDGIHGDKSKATYIERYHKDCEIKYIWEHEFKCRDKIVELIKYWTGKTEIELINFDFDDVDIRDCPAKDYKLLLSKYHYLPNAGRGGMAFGAYVDGVLIAVCVFSPLIRQNLPWDNNSTRELSRLCIHPRYQKKNFASWFVSRCINKLDPKFERIISYCDSTFNHDGAVYKACNFRLDGSVKPDYWYVSEDGWVMHKKTLYEHAKKMGMKERYYAEKYNYNKVYGKEKLRFIYERGLE